MTTTCRVSDEIAPDVHAVSRPWRPLESAQLGIQTIRVYRFSSLSDSRSRGNRWCDVCAFLPCVPSTHATRAEDIFADVPGKRGEHARRAVHCAVDMQAALEQLNVRRKGGELPSVYMGIGINTGRVLAGLVGSQLYSAYTVINADGAECVLSALIQLQPPPVRIATQWYGKRLRAACRMASASSTAAARGMTSWNSE